MLGLTMVLGASGFVGLPAVRQLALEARWATGIGHGDLAAREASRRGIAERHAADVALGGSSAGATKEGSMQGCAGDDSGTLSTHDPYRDLEWTLRPSAALRPSPVNGPALRNKVPCDASSIAVARSWSRVPDVFGREGVRGHARKFRTAAP